MKPITTKIHPEESSNLLAVLKFNTGVRRANKIILYLLKNKTMLNWNNVLDFAKKGNPPPDRRVEKTEAEWKALLTPDQFRITRKKGTEAKFSGELCSLYAPGRYTCVCCGSVLFDSGIKYDSKTGWPSFSQPFQENAIKYEKDNAWGMQRIEVMCNVCDAHLGHVFPDGPPPSGLRYCINSDSLQHVITGQTRSEI